MNKQQQKQTKTIDYQLHKAQQLEILNANLELLKNNVYGQTQVDIVLYYMSEGKTAAEATELSLELIATINDTNLKQMQAKRAEIEAKMQAENPQNIAVEGKVVEQQPSESSPVT